MYSQIFNCDNTNYHHLWKELSFNYKMDIPVITPFLVFKDYLYKKRIITFYLFVIIWHLHHFPTPFLPSTLAHKHPSLLPFKCMDSFFHYSWLFHLPYQDVFCRLYVCFQCWSIGVDNQFLHFSLEKTMSLTLSNPYFSVVFLCRLEALRAFLCSFLHSIIFFVQILLLLV